MFDFNYETYIVDYDGTIIDSMKLWKNFNREWLIHIGIEPSEEILNKMKFISSLDAAKILIKEFNIDMDLNLMLKSMNDYFIDQYREVPLKDGALELLKLLKEKGKRVLLFSATPKVLLKPNLDTNNLNSYFDYIYSTSDMKVSKEDGSAYLELIKREGLNPSSSLVIEDSYRSLSAAKELGFNLLAIKDYSNSDKENKIKVITNNFYNLNELI